MTSKDMVVISVIINGEPEKMKELKVDDIAERKNKVIKGQRVEALSETDNERRCDGIDIGGFICIGSLRD